MAQADGPRVSPASQSPHRPYEWALYLVKKNGHKPEFVAQIANGLNLTETLIAWDYDEGPAAVTGLHIFNLEIPIGDHYE